MGTKELVYIGLGIGSIVGGGLGSLIDHGNVFGAGGLTLGTIGAFIGVWAGFKLGEDL